MGLGFRERFGTRILGRCDMALGGARFLVCFGVWSRTHVYSEVPLASPSRRRELRLVLRAMCPIKCESGCAIEFGQSTIEASCSDLVCHAK
jgi:hypothetical protein